MRWVAPAVVVFLAAAGCTHTPPNLAADNPTPAIVESVRLEGFEVLPIDVRERLDRELPIRVGEALTSEIETKTGERAVEILQNHGYPYAQAAIVKEPVDATHTRVTIRAQPGTLGYFGRIDIAGNRRVDDVIIRRRLAYAPGDLFRRSAIERTQQRIGTLGLFKSVEIRAQDITNQPAEIPTLITVQEQSPWQWNLALDYAAGDRLGFDARISNLNFLGAARRLDVHGRVSAIERTGDVAFVQIEAWHPSLSLSLQARHREIDERAFFVMSRGGQASVGWQWSRSLGTTFSYAAAFERSDVNQSLDPLLGLLDGMLNAWSVDVDHRRVAAQPSSGFSAATIDAPPTQILSAHVEQAGRWMPGTFNYFNLMGSATHYRRPFDNRLVLASRIRYGAIDPASVDADIPFLKRFFLGGPDEMRGWGVYELSPLSASGEPVGGKSFFTATGEVRFRIKSRLTGAVFAEAGNVWQDAWTLRLRDLVYDAGPGLRLQTPFGLIRIDLGYQLKVLDGLRIDGEPQQSRWRFNFGIGEAF
jgi:outer membrane protein assembly factor BamA